MVEYDKNIYLSSACCINFDNNKEFWYASNASNENKVSPSIIYNPKNLLDDKEILHGCLKRDERYQMMLYQKYAGFAFTIAYRYTGVVEDAKEVAQEAFIKVFNKLEKLQDLGSFKGWLRRIVANESVNYIRVRKRHIFMVNVNDQLFNESEILEDKPNDEEVKAELLAPQDVLQLLQQLPEKYRIVFVMSALDNISHKEIADQMGITENNSRAYLNRARKQLREMYQNQVSISSNVR